jgi:hypothetical protein
VVLDHNTVIFQKEKKGGLHIKITGMQVGMPEAAILFSDSQLQRCGLRF